MTKLSDLAHVLHQKTMERKLKWDIQDDESIVTNVGKNSIVISGVSQNALIANKIYKLTIYNLSGSTVDEQQFFPAETSHKFISEMMVRARRDALRADETLDEIMERVGKM